MLNLLIDIVDGPCSVVDGSQGSWTASTVFKWYSEDVISWIIIVFPLVEFLTSSRFVGTVSTSAAAAGVSSWVGISS